MDVRGFWFVLGVSVIVILSGCSKPGYHTVLRDGYYQNVPVEDVRMGDKPVGAGSNNYAILRPIIDEASMPGFDRSKFNRDRYECTTLAMQTNRSALADGVGGALFGALVGAALGAATGAGADYGALVGSASGGFSGLGGSVAASDQAIKSAMITCMNGRGYSVLGFEP